MMFVRFGNLSMTPFLTVENTPEGLEDWVAIFFQFWAPGCYEHLGLWGLGHRVAGTEPQTKDPKSYNGRFA